MLTTRDAVTFGAIGAYGFAESETKKTSVEPVTSVSALAGRTAPDCLAKLSASAACWATAPPVRPLTSQMPAALMSTRVTEGPEDALLPYTAMAMSMSRVFEQVASTRRITTADAALESASGTSVRGSSYSQPLDATSPSVCNALIKWAAAVRWSSRLLRRTASATSCPVSGVDVSIRPDDALDEFNIIAGAEGGGDGGGCTGGGGT